MGLCWPKVQVVCGQIAVVVGSYLLREYLCWPENDFCSLANGICLRSWIVIMAGPPIAIALVALAGILVESFSSSNSFSNMLISGLLVEDWYGWTELVGKLHGICQCQSGQVAPDAEGGDIELQNMNFNNQQQTVYVC